MEPQGPEMHLSLTEDLNQEMEGQESSYSLYLSRSATRPLISASLSSFAPKILHPVLVCVCLGEGSPTPSNSPLFDSVPTVSGDSNKCHRLRAQSYWTVHSPNTDSNHKSILLLMLLTHQL